MVRELEGKFPSASEKRSPRLKVVELLKPCGAQSFLEYGAGYVPHLGDKTRCFLTMFITHVLLKICKYLALYPRASQQNIKQTFGKSFLHRPVQPPQCTHHNLPLSSSRGNEPRSPQDSPYLTKPSLIPHAFPWQTLHLCTYPP